MKKNKENKPKLVHVVICFLLLIIFMLVGITYYGVDPHIPMFFGVIVAGVISICLGFKWNKLENMMVQGISKAMQSILILVVVGILVAVWIMSGTVPSMIYYGLMLIKPSYFLVAAMLVCTITSLATGTSWGTMGTMGLAITGIGAVLNVPIGPTAGAVICGSYFGDKMSPLSDSTNLAATMAGTDVFTNIKYMLRPTIISYVIALVFFAIYGIAFNNGTEDITVVNNLMDSLSSTFYINPVLLIPPLVVVLSIVLKIPALPGITFGALCGMALALIFQPDLCVYNSNGDIINVGVNFGNILSASKDGFYCYSDENLLQELLTTGGIMSMSSSILMVVIAMMFGGIVEGTGQLDVLMGSLLKHVKSDLGIVTATEVTCLFSNIVMPEQYISILIPGRMFNATYRKRGLHPKCLSNALESSGTVTSPLIPWNTCALFIYSTLGVLPFGPDGYFIWSIFNLLVPIINLIMAAFKITITKMTKEEQKLADAGSIVV